MSELKKPDVSSSSLNGCLAQGHEGSRATVGVYWLSETGLVGFWVVWTREELGFISLEGFLLSLGFLDSKGS